jgi:hypothetical protein
VRQGVKCQNGGQTYRKLLKAEQELHPPSERGDGGGLVVLLLAERARSYGLRSTRALEDRPGRPLRGVERWKARDEKAWKGHPRWSCAPGTRAPRKEMRGRARWSPVLVQRAVSEDPRWTRAVGDRLADPQGRNRRAVHRSMRGVM